MLSCIGVDDNIDIVIVIVLGINGPLQYIYGHVKDMNVTTYLGKIHINMKMFYSVMHLMFLFLSDTEKQVLALLYTSPC